MRRAKMICTLGPAVSSYERVRALIDAGMDVARFNLSHGEHPGHEERYSWVRQAADETGHGTAVLVDLQGPKIRLGRFATGPVHVSPGDIFTITTDDIPGDQTRCSTTYDGLPRDVRPDDRILIDDGRVVLQVVSVEDTEVVTRVL